MALPTNSNNSTVPTNNKNRVLANGADKPMPVLVAEQNVPSNIVNRTINSINNGTSSGTNAGKRQVVKSDDELEMVDEVVKRLWYDVKIVQLGRCKARCLFVELHGEGVFIKRLYNQKLIAVSNLINKFNTDLGSDDFAVTLSKFGDDQNPNVLRGVYLFLDLQADAAVKLCDPLHLTFKEHGFGRGK